MACGGNSGKLTPIHPEWECSYYESLVGDMVNVTTSDKEEYSGLLLICYEPFIHLFSFDEHNLYIQPIIIKDIAHIEKL